MTTNRRRIITYACDRCTATVALTVKGRAWCTRCGRSMKPITTTPATASRTPHDAV